MRKIKTFRVFEKSDDPFFTDEEKLEIRDICQEIIDEDSDLKIEIKTTGIVKITKTKIWPSAPLNINGEREIEVSFRMTEAMFETIKRLESFLDRADFSVFVMLPDEYDTRKIYLDESSSRAFLMSDKGSRYKEQLLGGPMTKIMKLFIEI